MPGQAIRPSQFILTYGVGSIIETSEGPVIIPDFEKWGKVFGFGRSPGVSQFEIPGSSVISSLLDNGNVFRIPTNADIFTPDNQPIFHTIPFPGWALCVRHSRLYELRGGRTLCTNCISEKYSETEIKKQAIRFVRACSDGHLDDVDWFGLIHSGNANACSNRTYNWILQGSSLRNVIIACQECGRRITLSDAYNRTSHCTGRFPERGFSTTSCDNKASVRLRGSSSLRIPELISTIQIPLHGSPLHRKLDTLPIRTILSSQQNWTKDDLLNRLGNIKKEAPDILDPNIIDYIEQETDERIIQVIEDIKKAIRNRPATIEEVRVQELRALQEAAEFGQPPNPESNDPDFQVKIENVRSSVRFRYRNLRVAPIERLSVIIIQRGYRRLDTGNTVVPTFYYDGNTKWFPGIKLKGEGVFIDSGKDQLNVDSSDWMRMFSLTRDPFQHPVAVWWHTLAHRIVSALSIDSGYSSAAIREMVYININSNNKISAGILLYTSQQGGDGSLGGLIALVPEFENVLESAIRNIDACSNDPLCSEESVLSGKSNGAACYACLLLSETSCSHKNMHLDRNVLRNNL